jgi:hypothetical protein
VEAINVILSRNLTEKNWSVEIDGNLYEHISTKTLDDLVEYALIAAQQSLLEVETPADSSSEMGSGASPHSD